MPRLARLAFAVSTIAAAALSGGCGATRTAALRAPEPEVTAGAVVRPSTANLPFVGHGAGTRRVDRVE